MRIPYNKLIRDQIPAVIEQNGGTCGTAVMNDEEFLQALREKLVEEAREAAEASADHLVTELADVYEVMDALVAQVGLTRDQLLAEQERRRATRGGFTQRLRLLWTE